MIDIVIELLALLFVGDSDRRKNGDAEARVETDEGYRVPDCDLPWIGKRGRVVSPMRPAGQVQIDGEEKEAVSDDGDLVPGQVVQVVGAKRGRLRVRAVEGVDCMSRPALQ